MTSRCDSAVIWSPSLYNSDRKAAPEVMGVTRPSLRWPIESEHGTSNIRSVDYGDTRAVEQVTLLASLMSERSVNWRELTAKSRVVCLSRMTSSSLISNDSRDTIPKTAAGS